MKPEEFNRDLKSYVTALIQKDEGQDKGAKVLTISTQKVSTEDGLGFTYKIVIDATLTKINKPSE